MPQLSVMPPETYAASIASAAPDMLAALLAAQVSHDHDWSCEECRGFKPCDVSIRLANEACRLRGAALDKVEAL